MDNLKPYKFMMELAALLPDLNFKIDSFEGIRFLTADIDGKSCLNFYLPATIARYGLYPLLSTLTDSIVIARVFKDAQSTPQELLTIGECIFVEIGYFKEAKEFVQSLLELKNYGPSTIRDLEVGENFYYEGVNYSYVGYEKIEYDSTTAGSCTHFVHAVNQSHYNEHEILSVNSLATRVMVCSVTKTI